MTTIKLIIIAIFLLAIAVTGIAIKMFFKKGAAFQKHCASEQAKKKDTCVCHSDKGNCHYRTIHHPVESLVDDE